MLNGPVFISSTSLRFDKGLPNFTALLARHGFASAAYSLPETRHGPT
jgi:hypothetical protein